ncbi:MAG: SMI1/KNR4 family protein [Myxococcota bacterium]
MTFDLPPAFTALRERGAFDYWGGRAYADLSHEDRSRIAHERRFQVLWLRDLEWAASGELAEDPDLRPGLFPFAHNGAGDVYAFFPQWPGRGGEPSILFVPHDEMTANVFGTSFSQFLLHKWLDTARWWDEHYDGPDRLEALRTRRALIESVAEAPERAVLASLSPALDTHEVQAALDALVASLPQQALAAQLRATEYDPQFVKGAHAVRAYGESIAFYEKLVAEGHARFQQQLDEARANFAAATRR